MESGFGMDFREGASKYNDDSQAKFRADVDETLTNFEALCGDDEAARPVFQPPSSITRGHMMQEKSFFVVLFLAEAQIVKYCKGSSKALNLKPFTREDEHGGPIVGFYLSPADLPSDVSAGDLMSFRKVEISKSETTVWDEEILAASQQIRQQQGQDLFPVVQQRQERHMACKPSYLQYLPTMKTLRERADVATVNKDQKAKDIADKIAADQTARTSVFTVPPVSESESEEEDDDDRGKAMAKSKMMKLSIGSAGKQLTEAQKSTHKKKVPGSDKKKRPRDDSPGASSRGGKTRAQGTLNVLSPEDITEKMSQDQILLKVCLRLGTVPNSLPLCTQKNVFAGVKIGVQLNGAPTLVVAQNSSKHLLRCSMFTNHSHNAFVGNLPNH